MLKRLITLIFMLPTISGAQTKDKLIPTNADSVCSDIITYQSEAVLCYDHPKFGKELHVLNGDRISLKLLLDLGTGPGDSTPTPLFVFNSELYFLAETAITGQSLWAYNGDTNSVRLVSSAPFKDITQSHEKKIFGESDGALFFRLGTRIYVSDGTKQGTHFLGFQSDVSEVAHILNGDVYYASFEAFNQVPQSEHIEEYIPTLIRGGRDGSITVIKKFDEASEAFLLRPKVFGRLYIFIRGGANFEDAYWLSDGTSDGTEQLGPEWYGELRGNIDEKMIFGIQPTLSVTTDLINYTDLAEIASPSLQTLSIGGRLFFASFDGSYITDGTAEGTFESPITFDDVRSTTLKNGTFVGIAWGAPSELLFGNAQDQSTKSIIKLPGRFFNNVLRPNGSIHFNVDQKEVWFANANGENPRKVFDHGNNRVEPEYEHFATIAIEGQRVYYTVYDRERESRSLWHADGSETGNYQVQLLLGQTDPTSPNIEYPLLPSIILLLDEE